MDKNNWFKWSAIHYEILEVEPGTEKTVDFGIKLLRRKVDRDVFEKLYTNAITREIILM